MGLDEKKKKITIIVVSSVLLVAVIGSLTYGFIPRNGQSNPDQKSGDNKVLTSTKAAKGFCQPTDYKETCWKTLIPANTTDPKKLIKVTFQAAINNTRETIKNSPLLNDDSPKDNDPMVSKALDVCKEVLGRSKDEIKSSSNKLDAMDITHINTSAIGDIRTWISSAITYRQTCLDAFENTTGETGEKMKALLQTGNELTSNALAIITSYGESIHKINEFEFSLSSIGNRRLLNQDDQFPSFVDETSRRFLLNDKMTTPKPNVVVAQDESGEFKTITEAIKKVPKDNKNPFVIYVKEGVYEEYVDIPKGVNRVVLIGDGPNKTKITGNKNSKDGIPVWRTATVNVDGNNFIGRDIGFENSAGSIKHQALAIRVTSDNSIFYNCLMDGYQDTVYAHDNRQFYRDCNITGTIDFVSGDAQAIFQNCKLIVRNPIPETNFASIAAHGRTNLNNPSGFIFHKCEILAAPDLNDVKDMMIFLGRPWRMYARTIYIESKIEVPIMSKGWKDMGSNTETAYFAEFGNQGPGADTSGREQWKSIQKIDKDTAMGFKPERFYQGGDDWIKSASIPYDAE